MSLENYSPEAISELAALSKRLSEDPSTRKEFLRLTKRVHPDLPVPEIEMEDAVEKRVRAAEDQVSKLQAQLKSRDVREELTKRRNNLKSKGFAQSDDDILEIEKLMTEKGIGNHETAADYWQKSRETAVPTSNGFPRPVMAQFDIKGYMKNPIGAARENAVAALAELRKNPRPIGL